MMTHYELAKKLAEEIKEKQHQEAQSKISRPYPVKSNWASIIGHPCLRFKVYHRLNWEEKATHNEDLQYVFDEGLEKERWAIRRLLEMGYRVTNTQGSGDKDSLFEKANIGLKIDGRIETDEFKPVIEVKTMTPYDYDKINSYEDLKNSDNWRMKSYVAQGQLCLLKMGVEGGLFLLLTYRKPIKPIPFPLEYEVAEWAIREAEKVNEWVARNSLPDPQSDLPPKIHSQCPFLHICPVQRTFGEEVSVVEDEEIVSLLDERGRLQKEAARFKEVDERIKEYFRLRPKSIAGDWYIETNTSNSYKYSIPPDIKQAYKVPCERVTVKIENVKMEKGGVDAI